MSEPLSLETQKSEWQSMAEYAWRTIWDVRAKLNGDKPKEAIVLLNKAVEEMRERRRILGVRK